MNTGSTTAVAAAGLPEAGECLPTSTIDADASFHALNGLRQVPTEVLGCAWLTSLAAAF